MKKNILLYTLLYSLFLSGCSHFTFNASMCDQIASDPNAVMPNECRNYDEEEADKAFHQTKDEQESQDVEIIKFQQEEDDK